MSEEEQLRYALQISSMEMDVDSPNLEPSQQIPGRTRHDYANATLNNTKTSLCQSIVPQKIGHSRQVIRTIICAVSLIRIISIEKLRVIS